MTFPRDTAATPRGIPHLLPPETVRRARFTDRFETRVANWLQPWDFVSPLDVGLISIPLSKSSITPNSTYAAPNALREVFTGFTTYSPDFDVDIASLRVRELGEVSIPVMDIPESVRNIEECLEACFRQPEGFFPVIVGGDHSVTAPAVRAYCHAHPDQQVGLIHFDAHNDVRVLDHGPTNGTPIRSILQSGIRVDGSNIAQIGIHGFMNSSHYKKWVEAHGATIFTGRQVRRDGIENVLERAIELAANRTDAIYVTVDIDVLELGYSAGTGVAGPEGIHPTDLFEAMFTLGQRREVVAVDFVELDPRRDIAQITTRTFASALLTFLGGLFLRLNNGWRGYDPEMQPE
jgi:formiminoglutamase